MFLHVHLYVGIIYLYLDNGPQGLWIGWAIQGHSTLLPVIILWPLGAFGDPQL